MADKQKISRLAIRRAAPRPAVGRNPYEVRAWRYGWEKTVAQRQLPPRRQTSESHTQSLLDNILEPFWVPSSTIRGSPAPLYTPQPNLAPLILVKYPILNNRYVELKKARKQTILKHQNRGGLLLTQLLQQAMGTASRLPHFLLAAEIIWIQVRGYLAALDNRPVA